MHRWIRGLAALLLWLPALAAVAAEVEGLRIAERERATRLVITLDAPAEHRIFTLTQPDRVVIDIPGSRLATDRLPRGRGIIRGIRHGVRNRRDLRIVLDLKAPAKPRSFLLPEKEGRSGQRLVVDLVPASRARRPVKSVEEVDARPRDLIVAVDPGHGGKDPGARGRRGTREKDVVLAIARELARLIDTEPGMRAVMTRRDDRFLRLRDRIRIAHRHRADLFVSIHADAFRDRRVRGSSVFVLSRRGASSEMARLLARHENAADLVGGVSLADKDDVLRSVLLDLSQAASIEASTEVASSVLRELSRIGKVHKRSVQRAGFVVLKSPDIPSILVETAFISNPDEERKLRDPRHQKRLARAILRGIRRYFADHPPPGTWLAMRKHQREHLVRRGDTLIKIANRYDVSLKALRRANGIKGSHLRVGQRLVIPASSDS